MLAADLVFAAKRERIQDEGRGAIDKFVAPKSVAEELFLKWLVNSYRNIDDCEDGDFRNFLRAVAPKYEPMSRERVRNGVLMKAAKVLTDVNTVVNDQYIAITTDTWTSVSNVTFSSLTAHFIDSNWKHVDLPIGCFNFPGKHTASDCDRQFRHILSKCGIKEDHIVAVTTDNEATMNAWGDIMEWEWIGCIDHLINLITKIAFDDESIRSTMLKARQMVTFFSHSSQANEQLDRMQHTLDPRCVPLKVINDVSTRWWSTYF